MWKHGQGWQSTEPRMTHLFAEERPLELGFEGQKVAGRPFSRKSGKCQDKNGRGE